jgi:hypothetical protein
MTHELSMNITTDGNRALDGLDIGLLHEDFPSLSFQSLIYENQGGEGVCGDPSRVVHYGLSSEERDGIAGFGTEEEKTRRESKN